MVELCKKHTRIIFFNKYRGGKLCYGYQGERGMLDLERETMRRRLRKQTFDARIYGQNLGRGRRQSPRFTALVSLELFPRCN